MLMNGEILTGLSDLKRCFSIDELLYSYATVNWRSFWKKSGNIKKQRRFGRFPKIMRCF